MPTPPMGDMAWAASPMGSNPARTMPQPVHLHPQRAHVLPAPQLAYAVLEERDQLGHRGPEATQPRLVQLVGGGLGDEVGDLPVDAPVEQDQQVPGGQPAEGLRGVGGAPRQAEPEHVDGHAELGGAQPGRAAQLRVAAVGGHGQPGPHLVDRPGPVAPRQARHPAGLLQHAERLGLHAQLEGRQPAGLADDEVEEVPLGHEGQEPVAAGQPAEVGQGEVAGVGGDPQDLRLLMRHARSWSARPSSSNSRRVEGCRVSPRKSRRKSPCFSSTRTSTPERASSSPSTAPAGPQPAIQHVTRVAADGSIPAHRTGRPPSPGRPDGLSDAGRDGAVKLG